MKPRHRFSGVIAAFFVTVAGFGAGAGPASASGDPLANPGSNRQPPPYSTGSGLCSSTDAGPPICPSPCFPHEKLVYNGSAKCAALLLRAINEAQKAEHVRAMVLPTNYFRLSITEQLFVVVNLERLSRGVPPLVGLSPYLDQDAAAGAANSQDPVFQASFGPVQVWLPPGGGYYGFGSTWAADSVDTLAAVFGWMYDDGWGGSAPATANYACTSAGAPGCWGHRDILLGKYTGTTCTDCLAGAGFASPAVGGVTESYSFVEVRPATASTDLVFTWDEELAYLPPGWEHQKAS